MIPRKKAFQSIYTVFLLIAIINQHVAYATVPTSTRVPIFPTRTPAYIAKNNLHKINTPPQITMPIATQTNMRTTQAHAVNITDTATATTTNTQTGTPPIMPMIRTATTTVTQTSTPTIPTPITTRHTATNTTTRTTTPSQTTIIPPNASTSAASSVAVTVA